MDNSKALHIRKMMNELDRTTNAVRTLEEGGEMYFFCTGNNYGIVMPDWLRKVLICHFEKLKKECNAAIEAL
jgi:hypothetical protein